MEIRVPPEIRSKLIETLRKAGMREAGGVLMGECLAPSRFRIADLSIAPRGGFARFFRNLAHALDPLRRFFDRTGHQYRKLNYLGEWHSHPCFLPEPSACDLQSMLKIVEDPEVGATFAVLLIVRLENAEDLEGTATVFIPGGAPFRADLVWEI
jgi:[CysO sulfur-carrier protein]-S-L-cysteine hydrolase